MTINTIKMSQFANADPNNPTNTLAGISDPAGGINIKTPLTETWTTAGRPMMPYDGLMGYNTTLEEWEFFQNSTNSWIQFATSNSGEIWTVVTDPTFNAVKNEGIIANRVATPVVITLPAIFNPGDRVLVMGQGTGGWNLVCNTGQQIIFGSSATSVDGSINSDIRYSNIEVKGMIANTTWTCWSINSNPSIL